MKPTPTETILIFLILATLGFFINPFMAWTPSAFHYMAVGGLVVLIAFFVGLLWREQPRDEREELHRFIGSRFAYIVGVVTLTTAVALQSISSIPDVWLVSALAAMVLAKLLGHLYAQGKN